MALSIVTAMLVACGSGQPGDASTALLVQSKMATAPAQTLPAANAASTSSAAASTTTVTLGRTVVVRASGSPADGVAPRMTVAVDGKVLQPGPVEVATTTADHTFTSDTDIVDGALVTLTFDNDAVITVASGEVQDRNLYVDSITIGNVTVPSTAPDVVLLRESGETMPGQRDIWWNATMRITAKADSGATQPGPAQPATPDQRLAAFRTAVNTRYRAPAEWAIRTVSGGSVAPVSSVCPNGGTAVVSKDGQVQAAGAKVEPPYDVRFDSCAGNDSAINGNVTLLEHASAGSSGGSSTTRYSVSSTRDSATFSATLTQGAQSMVWTGKQSYQDDESYESSSGRGIDSSSADIKRSDQVDVTLQPAGGGDAMKIAGTLRKTSSDYDWANQSTQEKVSRHSSTVGYELTLTSAGRTHAVNGTYDSQDPSKTIALLEDAQAIGTLNIEGDTRGTISGALVIDGVSYPLAQP